VCQFVPQEQFHPLKKTELTGASWKVQRGIAVTLLNVRRKKEGTEKGQ
jgi:hypothetical protein